METVAERPANRIRSAMRLFVSETEDKAWYNDRAFWRDYLTMLATHRFNRFNLALGLGYDGPAGLTDAYFYYAYPFLVTVPGHDARVEAKPGRTWRCCSSSAARRRCGEYTFNSVSGLTRINGRTARV
jgi:hypothetical protein